MHSLLSHSLAHACGNLAQRFDDELAALCEAGKLAEKLHDSTKARRDSARGQRNPPEHDRRALQVKELRAQVEQLVLAHDTLLLHTQALEALKSRHGAAAGCAHKGPSVWRALMRPRPRSYQCTAQVTDFQAWWQRGAGACFAALDALPLLRMPCSGKVDAAQRSGALVRLRS